LPLILTFCHKWSRLLKQQTLITVYLADQGKQTSVSENKRSLPFSVFQLQQTNGVAVFRTYTCTNIYIYSETAESTNLIF
jgi:hypothetical protein